MLVPSRAPIETMATPAPHQTDVFFRHLVGNMRNGVLAIARDGEIGRAHV